MKKIIIISSLLLTCLASISCTSSGTEDSIMNIDNTASLSQLKTIEIEILELINN
jgi:ABC-type Fe3+-citrate transport system substrate-binding protein